MRGNSTAEKCECPNGTCSEVLHFIVSMPNTIVGKEIRLHDFSGKSQYQ